MRILLVDDERRFARVLADAIAAEGDDRIDVAHDFDRALATFDDGDYDAVVTDLRLGDASGIELLAHLRRRRPRLPVVLMTAFADVATAREALKRGAVDYLVKPFEVEELMEILDQNRPDSQAGDRDSSFAGMIGGSPAMREVFSQLRRFADADVPVLIAGETGTGKELAARSVHALSPRHRGPFVPLNVATIPESILESELFGHERGAFTGAERAKAGLVEQAAGGTLFLDEIGELLPSLQPKLLRFLQERSCYRVGGTKPYHVDVRVVAATNRDLRAEVDAGRFRQDLYYRLDVARVELPPLRARGEDVELLAEAHLGRRAIDPDRLTARARVMLRAHRWPGNVRELENVLDRALLLAGEGPIDGEHLAERLGAPEPGMQELDDGPGMGLEEQERRLIRRALEQAGGNRAEAARILGISRRRLYSRFKSLGLDPDAE